MKILEVSHSFVPCYKAGGVVRVVYELSKILVKKGHDVTVFTTDGCDNRLNVITNKSVLTEGINVYYFKNISNLFRIKWKIATPPIFFLKVRNGLQDYDLIHLHEYISVLNIIVYYYAKRYKIPYIVQAHGSLPHNNTKKIFRILFDYVFGYRLLNGASKVIALNQNEAKQYELMHVPKNKITIIPNGIDFTNYYNLPPKGLFKNKYLIPKDKKIILYLGRLNKNKGIDFLIESYASFLKKPRYNTILVIAGSDDGYLKEIIELINRYQIAHNVIITGGISEEDKRSVFVDSNICAYLGPFEPFGLVPFEATLSNLPVIVAEGTPMANILNREKFGFSVKYNDVLQLEQLFESILNNEEIIKNLIKDNKNNIINNFDWVHIVKMFEQVYEDVTVSNQK